jgi:calnexin
MREAKRITLRLAIVLLLAFVSFNQLFADDDTVIIVD